MKELFDEVYRNLTTCIIPFWKKLIDTEHGGFYGRVDNNLVVYEKNEKGTILCSRILWFFSEAYRVLKDESLVLYAEQAYKYLINHCFDAENGGVIWSTTYDGKPLDTTKHSYNHAFAIYALAAYYESFRDSNALQKALDLYDIVETRFMDGSGYTEAYDIEFNPIPNDKLSENGVMAEKTMNTALHILEAYTVLLKVIKMPDTDIDNKEYYRNRIEESVKKLLDIFADNIYQGKSRLEVFFDKDYKSLINLQSYGHDIEASWLIDRALEVLDDVDYSRKIGQITDLLARSVKWQALVKDGSVVNECENNRVDTTRVWWVQAESIVGFMNYYMKKGDTKYLETAKGVWDYCCESFIDKREGSEWFAALNALGEPYIEKDIVDPWKCPYHNGRMCLEVINRIKKIESR